MPARPAPRVFISPCPEAIPNEISWVKHPPLNCSTNRFTYCYSTNALTKHMITWTHNGCLCNQIIALTHRHQVATPIPLHTTLYPMNSEIEFSPIAVFTKYLTPPLDHLLPWKRHKVVNSYQGRWRKKYFDAQQLYHATGLMKKYSAVNMFVKDDLEMTCPIKAPRAIQYRHPVFALEQGRFTKPMEEWLYAKTDEFGTKIFAKSDPFTVAAMLLAKSKNFSEPVYLMLDASKFDSCVDKEWLKIILKCYLKLFPRKYHRFLCYIWKQTFVNRGRTRKGLTFLTHGTRMSGDMDTSLGNCIIMFLMLKIYLIKHNIKHSLMINGDDSLIVIERRDLAKSRDIGIFKEFGFNMKFEVATNIEEAEFCQARFINTDYGPTMSRNPIRILGRTSWTTTKYGRKDIRAFLNTIGLCERAASYGVPIASALATKLIEMAATSRKVTLSPWLTQQYLDKLRPWKTGPPKITLETRTSFESAWGISVADQLRIENSIKVTPVFTITNDQRDDYDSLINGRWGDFNPNAWPD